MSDQHQRSVGPVRGIAGSRPQPRNVLIANAKGGCGKTTLATNLAVWFAHSGKATALMDFDSQGSTAHWLKQRSPEAAAIVGIDASRQSGGLQTRSFAMRVPRDIDRVVVDTPAGLSGNELYFHTSSADLIIVPLMPSPIDIHAGATFIKELQLSGCLRDSNKKLLVIGNRVRKNTIMFAELSDFLRQIGMPGVTFIRDSQLYTRSAARGLGIVDIASYQAREEKERWMRIGAWVEHQLGMRTQSTARPMRDREDRLA